MSPTYESFLAEVDELIKGIAEEEGDYGTSREENFQSMVVALKLAMIAHPNAVPYLYAAALIALYDERGSHAMTASSFEIFAESSAETSRALTGQRDAARTELSDALRMWQADKDAWTVEMLERIDEVLRLREQLRHADTATNLAASCAWRYMLAWTSARRRATDLLDALVDADDERDMLRVTVAANNIDMTRLVVERDEALAQVEIAGQRSIATLKANLSLCTDLGTTRVERNAAQDAVRSLHVERDELRSEVVRLGKQLEARPLSDDDLRDSHHTVTTPYEGWYPGTPDRRVNTCVKKGCT